MKKNFQLRIEGKHPERTVEAVKHEIRKYVARERRRPLPEGADFLDFDGRIGPDADTAQPVVLTLVNKSIDVLVAAGATQFYLELHAKPGHWQPRAEAPVAAAAQAPPDQTRDASADH